MRTSLKDMYCTGVVWQDFQHGQLIDLFEDIKAARKEHKDKHLYRYSIAFLAMYVTHHFQLEEAYMKHYEYPQMKAHVNEHEGFIRELKSFRKEKSAYSEERAEELITNMGEWILSHILDDDQNLGKFIRDLKTGSVSSEEGSDILDIKYRTGVLWQDCQHGDWISLLIRLREAGFKKKDPALFHQILSFLVMYVNSHFSLEKVYMEKYDYPEKRFHLEEHRLFVLRLKDFREKYAGFEDEVTSRIIENINEWVYSHIQENDKKLGAFILKSEQMV